VALQPDSSTVKRPPLRYFGSKWMLAPWIIEHMPEHRAYIEPFGGGAGVLLRKLPARHEVYNDLDDEIVGVFRVLQNPATCSRLIRLLKRVPYARSEFREAFQPTPDPIVRAQRAIMRSFASIHHSALFMSGKSSAFASCGQEVRSWVNYPRHLVSICRRLRGVVIECRDALEVIHIQDAPDALFFIDPPYIPTTRDMSAKYRYEMDETAHVRLLEALLDIQGQVMVAGYPTDIYDRMLAGWIRLERQHYARCGRGGFKGATEVLWISPPKG
jgi:DNA adenine methylase